MKVYTIEQVAEILQLSVSSVRKLINDGKIKKLNTDGIIRVSESQLNEYLEG